ncbi:uncharacterized protein LOC126377457 [Pectinophora gossypiella]|uniref:uncharacterized protein LOC126377457 n=1 Tax=Pectinophora gossypiella TaxID=13191 RepID=UPI00214EC622|nr:uncharacterized protein LOC126377457 [Pectinophora gossypiella]
MGMLMGCGVCCSCLSIWAIIQLSLMGYFYHIETAILIEDVHAHKEDYNTYDEYIKATRNNYYENSINCWIAAVAYAVTLIISCVCIMSARKSAKKRQKLEEDDEYVCTPKPTQFEKEMAKRRAKAAKKKGQKPPKSPKKPKSPKTVKSGELTKGSKITKSLEHVKADIKKSTEHIKEEVAKGIEKGLEVFRIRKISKAL